MSEIRLEPENDLAREMNLGEKTLFLTQSSYNQLRSLYEQEDNPETCLRVTVLSGGCSGFQYKFEFDANRDLEDLVFKHDDVKIVTDEASFDLIQGVVIDYVQELIGSAFTLKNPNASVSCGCGNSFSL